MTAAVFFFFFPVQRRRLLPFLQWCSNGWEEDDELRKADYGVGSAVVFVLLVALVSRQPAVVALPLLFSVVASSLYFCHLVSLQTILCLSLSVSPPFSFFLLLLCVVVLFFFFTPPPFGTPSSGIYRQRRRGSPYPVQAQGMVAGAWVFCFSSWWGGMGLLFLH
jgi:hypothetical protein